MSDILSSLPTYGLEALVVACETALEEKAVSSGVILNYLARLTEEPKAGEAPVPAKLALLEEPRSDCSVYDRLLSVSGDVSCCEKVS